MIESLLCGNLICEWQSMFWNFIEVFNGANLHNVRICRVPKLVLQFVKCMELKLSVLISLWIN